MTLDIDALDAAAADFIAVEFMLHGRRLLDGSDAAADDARNGALPRCISRQARVLVVGDGLFAWERPGDVRWGSAGQLAFAATKTDVAELRVWLDRVIPGWESALNDYGGPAIRIEPLASHPLWRGQRLEIVLADCQRQADEDL